MDNGTQQWFKGELKLFLLWLVRYLTCVSSSSFWTSRSIFRGQRSPYGKWLILSHFLEKEVPLSNLLRWSNILMSISRGTPYLHHISIRHLQVENSGRWKVRKMANFQNLVLRKQGFCNIGEFGMGINFKKYLNIRISNWYSSTRICRYWPMSMPIFESPSRSQGLLFNFLFWKLYRVKKEKLNSTLGFSLGTQKLALTKVSTYIYLC